MFAFRLFGRKIRMYPGFFFYLKKKIAPFDSSAGKAEGCRGDLKKKKHTDAFSSFKQ